MDDILWTKSNKIIYASLIKDLLSVFPLLVSILRIPSFYLLSVLLENN